MDLTKLQDPFKRGSRDRNRKSQRDSKHERINMHLLTLKMEGALWGCSLSLGTENTS